jgi:trigger factor
MNVNVETASTLRRKVTIELEPDEIGRELDRSYAELKRSVHLKGFRPGHAPRPLLERMFGDQVRAEVIQKLTREYTDKALAEQNLTPVVTPEIVTEETDLKKVLRFSAVFDVAPQVEVKDYQQLRVQPPSAEVNEEQIDQTLQRMREQMAPIKRVEGRDVVQSEDFAVVELEAYDAQGQPVAGSKMDHTLVKISDKSLAHGLDQLLIGVKVGEHTSRQRSYPAEYEEKDLAGKTIEWRLHVHDLFHAELAALDDEFAKDQGDYENLAQLRAKLREDLLAQTRRQAQAQARDGLIELILERNPVDVPESLVNHELAVLEGELSEALQARGMAAEQAHEQAHKQHDELRPRAVKRAHTALVLDAIAEQEQVMVEDEELARAVGEIVSSSGAARERAAKYYAEESNRAELRRALRREKTSAMLFTRASAAEEEPAEAKAQTTSPEAKDTSAEGN